MTDITSKLNDLGVTGALNMKFILPTLAAEGQQMAQLTNAKHAITTLCSYNGAKYVIKRIGSHYPNFSAKQAMLLSDLLQQYYDRLKEAGIPVPPGFECFVEGCEVVAIAPYCGEPIRDVITELDIQGTVKAIEAVLLVIGQFFDAPVNNLEERGCWLRLSLDPTPNNFTLDSQGNIFYVDFTPTMWKEDVNALLPPYFNLTEELAKRPDAKNFRYFNKNGVILTFLTKCWNIWPGRISAVCKTLTLFLEERGEVEVLRYFEASIVSQIAHLIAEARSGHQAGRCQAALVAQQAAQQLVAQANYMDRDLLRLIVLMLTPPNFKELCGHFMRHGLYLPPEIDSPSAYFNHIFSSYRQLKCFATEMITFAAHLNSDEVGRPLDGLIRHKYVEI